jgi:uncharacterized protein (TIGR03083 family)
MLVNRSGTMSCVEIREHIDQLEAEGAALAAGAQRAGLDTAVAHCPDWAVRDVVTHIGGIHRWAAEIVGQELPGPDTAASDAVGVGPSDHELIEWFREGHRALVSTLRAAPANLACFAFLPAPSPLAFWARRQALETAVHRADADAASGLVAPLDHALAFDGIDEILIGFGSRPKAFEPGLMRLEPEGGPPWDVTLGAQGPAAVLSTTDGGAADVTDPSCPPHSRSWPAEIRTRSHKALPRKRSLCRSRHDRRPADKC